MGYMIEKEDYRFLYDYFDEQVIVGRFRNTLTQLNNFLVKLKVDSKCRIDIRSLKLAILDYFTDIARIKIFHNIEKVNEQKIYGYMGYWLLRHHVIHVIKPFAGSETINEKFIFARIISNIFSESGIDPQSLKNKGIVDKFSSDFFYFLKYRQFTQQSLELIVESFLCGFFCNR
jgi:hypothetical protein